ncbi:MAG: hypothetical protein RJA76_486 [Bacteroidota bacterium]|jgi:hypothetical protein
MGTIELYKVKFSFNKPKQLTEQEYFTIRSRVPMYPKTQDVTIMVIKKYWFTLLISVLFLPLVLVYILGGYYEPLQYARGIREKNDFIHKYYSIIYGSKDYDEYIQETRHMVENNSDLEKFR